jgi:beta-xylosidase
MKRPSICLVAFALAFMFTPPLFAQADDAGNLARNPIVWADVPDLAAIRVGDTYYMSSTTMHLSPGLPIMKSRDLVNWQLVGYAYDTLGDNDALTLQNGRNAYGAGSWASCLRYHDGTFYATTFSSTTGKTHVYRTKDIEQGPWTENSFRPSLHDHSLFFDDDGRVYMIHGAGNLRLVELTAEVSGIKPGGVDQVIITNASRVAGANIGLAAEGSQVWKINGKYYLFNITWPRGGMRTVIVHRADVITGPYEGRVALQDKGVAQGGLLDTPQGDWYAYLFRDYGAVGRIPYLVPVKWEDEWPILGVNGKVPDTLSLPASQGLIPGIVASDEFDRRPGDRALPLVWQWNHNPDDDHWSLAKRPGFLRLTAGRVVGDFLSARNTLTQRTFGPECSGTVCLDVSNMKDGDFAGLGALQKRYGLVGVKIAGNAKSIVLVSAESGSPVEVGSVPLTQDLVYLKVDCDFRDRADLARFFHSLDGKQWTAIGKPLRMTYTLPHFMGYRFALFNYATTTAGGFVDFDYFRVSYKIINKETTSCRDR